MNVPIYGTNVESEMKVESESLHSAAGMKAEIYNGLPESKMKVNTCRSRVE